jgi:hypothetical protein
MASRFAARWRLLLVSGPIAQSTTGGKTLIGFRDCAVFVDLNVNEAAQDAVE